MSWMDALRGSMILLVIVFHAASRVQRYDPDALEYVGYFNLFWEPFRMPVLVLLSGMLLSRSLSKPRGQYLIGKVRQLLWPYCVWSVVFIVLLYGTGAGANPEPLWVQLLGIVSGTATYLWFLSFLFVYYVLSLVVGSRVREVLIPMALLAAVPLLWLDGGYQWRKFLFLLAFFWLGDLITRRDMLRLPFLTNSAVVVASGVIAVGTGLVAAVGPATRYSPLTAAGVVAGVTCLVVAARSLSGTRVESILATVGRNTIVYYTSHYVIIAVTYFILNRIAGFSQPDVMFWILVVAALIGGWVLDETRRRIPVFNSLFVMPWRRTSVSA